MNIPCKHFKEILSILKKCKIFFIHKSYYEHQCNFMLKVILIYTYSVKYSEKLTNECGQGLTNTWSQNKDSRTKERRTLNKYGACHFIFNIIKDNFEYFTQRMFFGYLLKDMFYKFLSCIVLLFTQSWFLYVFSSYWDCFL